ncbi:ExbD/TolR family protein [Kordiimonas sp. SCSIO 12610]|uniref:ExbD/TolR family protein n=1 Tax=Kordiimonas sp. SCSIO 12610 TaxID=2829597 RepID=UPI002108C8DE|nr:ExbD/TolR family protein [Kordiimonas sp. SCSIO 12610]UTW54558.1 ExbD/TolR family protein [Kordiimonas sp. SCSIO 12610]
MGASVSNMGGKRGGGRGGRYQPLAEINVTPFVDVMLVLLIVFMVAAPLLTAGVQVELPKAQAKPLPQDSKPLEVTVDHEGAIFIVDSPINLNELGPRLTAISDNNKDVRIYVRGDTKLDYGRVMEVIGAINASGFTKVALIAEQR